MYKRLLDVYRYLMSIQILDMYTYMTCMQRCLTCMGILDVYTEILDVYTEIMTCIKNVASRETPDNAHEGLEEDERGLA